MWKPEHRRALARRDLRYPSDLTDAEWTLVGPLIPPAKTGGDRVTATSERFSTPFSMCSPRVAKPERQGRSKRGVALDPQGYDAGKKVTGRKRHMLVDTLGLLLSVVVAGPHLTVAAARTAAALI